MENLIVVESPTKAKTLSRFLGSKYQTVATMGHIRDLPPRSLGIDIKKKFKPKYIIPAKSRKIVKILKEKIKKAKNLWLATDFDREGEAIAWHVVEVTKPRVVPKRITFHEVTKYAILNALKKPRKIDPMLVAAQQSRRILDRLVGYKLSPFLWKKIASGLSAGRVQSVAVRIIVEKEQEIQNFKPQEYWQIIAKLKSKKGKGKNKEFNTLLVTIDNKEFDKLEINKQKADKILKDLKNAKFIVKNIEEKHDKKYPAPPFTTSSLQQEASVKLGFSAKKTMQIAQQLYEGVKISKKGRIGLITYMRTDSTQVSKKALKEAKVIIKKTFGLEYSLEKPRQYTTRIKLAQEAHEAIRPTIPSLLPDKIKKDLTSDQYKLYDLIWRRFIASQMKEAIFNFVIVDIKAKKYLFRARGQSVKFLGFLKLYGAPQVFALPPLAIEEELDLIKLFSEQKFTEAPARFTEASLIKALEKNGIGRPSTYAPIISTIQERNYVVKKGKYFYPEELGEIVTELLKKSFPKIVDIKFTAKMEDQLDDIALGKIKADDFLIKFWADFEKNLIKQEKLVKKDDIFDNHQIEEKCPECGKKLEVKFGKFGKFLSCSGFPKCKYSKPIIDTGSKIADRKIEKEVSGEKCEKCGADMVVKEGKFGQFLACSNYPKCMFTKPMIKKIGLKCPECKEGDIIERRTRSGKVFWGCLRYPKCQWASWENPLKNSSQLREIQMK